MAHLRTIQVQAHYFENYNFDGPNPHYKIKGTHTFEFEVDFDQFCYNTEEVKSIINDKIARWNANGNPHSCRYIPFSWELKDEVTDFGVIDVNEYEPIEERVKNEINPYLCSRAAKETINSLCSEDPRGDYRKQHVNYLEFVNANKEMEKDYLAKRNRI